MIVGWDLGPTGSPTTDSGTGQRAIITKRGPEGTRSRSLARRRLRCNWRCSVDADAEGGVGTLRPGKDEGALFHFRTVITRPVSRPPLARASPIGEIVTPLFCQRRRAGLRVETSSNRASRPASIHMLRYVTFLLLFLSRRFGLPIFDADVAKVIARLLPAAGL